MQPRRPSTSTDVWPWLALTLFYLAVTLWMTRPLAWQLTTVVPGPSGDNLYFTWLLHWYQTSLADFRWPVHVQTLNVPEGWSLAYNEMTPAMWLLSAPGFLAGAAFAYNLTFVLSFVLSGLFTALWVRRLTGRMAPAIVAGLIFAFAPYRLSHAFGHLNLMGTQWMPIYFLCLTEMLRGGRVWWSVGAALGFVALAGTSQYYLFMTALLSIPYALAIVRSRPASMREWPFLRNVAVAAAVALPLTLVLVWPYLELARQGFIVQHSLDNARVWSASVADFVLPSPAHWLLGDWRVEQFKADAWIERTLNVGLVSIVLGFAGWWSTQARREHAHVVRACAFAAAVAFVLALGMELHWFGRPVQLPVPQIARVWLETDVREMAIPLPGYLLFKYLPFYASMRVWMRWGIYVSLFLSVLAGLGFDRVTRHRSRTTQRSWTVAICLLVLVEFSTRPLPVTEVKGRPVDAWLAAQPGGPGDGVAELPVDRLGSPEATFYTMFHRHPSIGAFFSAFPSPQFRRIEPVLKGFPDAASIDTMKQLGVRWVVVDLARYDRPEDVREQARGFGSLMDVDNHMVLELR